MSDKYDNWERLVRAVLRRDEDRELARCDSLLSATDTSLASSVRSLSQFDFDDSPLLPQGLTLRKGGVGKKFYTGLARKLQMAWGGMRVSKIEDTAGVVRDHHHLHSTTDGKKYYMMDARKLEIAWGNDPRYWTWTSLPDSRFSQVAQLQTVCWLDIWGTLSCQSLSPNTNYASYLVFKLDNNHDGLHCLTKVSVSTSTSDDGNSVRSVKIGVNGKRRGDGWMELKLGDFFVGKEDRFDVVSRLWETEELWWKSGLIVEGIEMRPKGTSWHKL